MGAALPPETRRFRPDIEGMRAVAVLLVLLYHIGAPGFGGGFVGVDVFFVLSGFLITRLLVEEIASTGTIRIGSFYARRIRRLLPASALVTLTTFVGVHLLLSPLQAAEQRGDAVATSVYLANVQFARRGTAYLDQFAAASPFQHHWSLSLEEQFYLLWPLLLVTVAVVARRAGRDRSTSLLTVVGIVTCSSLLLGAVLTGWYQPWAFFLLPARAWELAIGGLLALGVGRLPAMSPRARTLAVAAGLGLVLTSGVTFGGVVAFPGLLALVPVAGTCLILLGGEGAGPFHRLLATRPLQLIGRRSYALYLWHWPLLVFAGGTPDGDRSWFDRVLLLVVAAALADLTYRFVEEPVRQHRRLVDRPGRTMALGAGLTTLTVGLALVATATPTLETGILAQEAEGRPVATVLGEAGDPVPDNLRPPLLEAREDNARVYADGCHATAAALEPPGPCVYGDPTAERTVVLFGDSHAAHWFPAVEAVARTHGWRLLSRTKSECAGYDLGVIGPDLPFPACARWREAVAQELATVEPDLVVVTGRYGEAYRDELGPARWAEAIEHTVRQLRTDVVVVGSMPDLPADVPSCLSANLQTPEDCGTTTRAGLDAHQVELARAATERAGGRFVDPSTVLCSGGRCPAVAGDLLVYRDENHLTASFAAYLATAVHDWLEPAATS